MSSKDIFSLKEKLNKLELEYNSKIDKQLSDHNKKLDALQSQINDLKSLIAQGQQTTETTETEETETNETETQDNDEVYVPIVTDEVKAFPSATGAGKYTTGGRGGIVVHVTNLNPSGVGSLAHALLMTEPRIIVKDVSGVCQIPPLLYLTSKNSNFTLAGQTAPEGGFTIDGGRVFFSGVTNYILRHVRFKGGVDADWVPNTGDKRGSASFSGVGDQHNFIVDHCSFSFGATMPTWTKQGSKEGIVDKGTVQKCLFSESNKGCIIGEDVNRDPYYNAGTLSFFKNIFYNVKYRTPNTTGHHEGNDCFEVVNNLTWNAQGRFIRGAGNQHLNHLNNAMYQRTFVMGDKNLNLWSKGYQNKVWKPKIYTKGNLIFCTSKGDLSYTVEQMNDNNKLSWKVFAWQQPDYGDQLPDEYFVDQPFPLHIDEKEVLAADKLRLELAKDSGCNARLNADGTVTDNLDVHDKEYLDNILNDKMVAPLPKDKYNVKPITSVNRPSDFYQSNEHIPQAYLDKRGISGNAEVHNKVMESGYTLIEEYINEVD